MKTGLLLLFVCGGLLPAADTRESLPSLVKQAQVAEQQNRLDEAITLYKRILRIRPGWGSAELNLGLVYHSRGDYLAAIRVLSEALRHSPELHSALLFRGASYHQLSRPEEAVRDLNEYLRHRPDDAEALPILGDAWLARGDPAEAAVAYAALARVSGDAAAWFRLSDCYARLAGRVLSQMWEKEASSFRQALTASHESGCRIEGDAELTSVRCGAEDGEFESSTRKLIAVLATPVRSSEAAARLADTLSRLVQLAAGKVVAVAPQSGWAALLRARAADEAGKTEAAEAEYKSAVSAVGGTADMYVRYGQFQCRHGQLEAGLASYERALQMDPSTTGVMGLIGEVHLLQSRPQQAIDYLRKALQANPRETQSRLYLARALNETGRTAQAVQVLEAAPEDPDGRIHYMLGRAYTQQGEAEKARKAMDIYRQRRGTATP